MGTLGGHLLPGSFFIIFALWWSFITAIRYAQSKMKSPYKKNSIIGYRSSVTMPCICCPCGVFRRAPIESILKATLATIGILGEVITGFHWTQIPKYKVTTTTSEPMQMEHHVNKREAAITQANQPEMIDSWFFLVGNGQHITMYSAFVLGSIVEILKHYRFDIPAKLDFCTGILAFGVEAYLFAFHLHGKDALEVHIHVLLVYAIVGCAFFCCLEWYNPNEILFTYGRILCTLLQGTWFFQIGFVLYPPTDAPEWKWDPTSHHDIMIITMAFCWHIMLIMVGLLIQMSIVKRIYASSRRVSIEWDELLVIDDINNRPEVTSATDGSETKFLRLLSEDESGDEKIEFDSMKMELKSKQQSTASSSGNSSGGKSPV